MHTMSHAIAFALTLCYTPAGIAWTHKKRHMPWRTSSALTTMRIGLISCVEATILGRE